MTIALLSISSGGVGWYFLQPKHSPIITTKLSPQQTKTVTVLVADFDGVDVKNYRVTDTILQKLQEGNRNLQTVKILPLKQVISQQEGKDKARELGKGQNADIVIWGWYGKTEEKAIVSVNFEMLSEAKDYLDLGKQVQGDFRTMAVASLRSFEMQINLAEELKYLTLVTVGVSTYAADDWDNAIKQLTAALSEVKANKAALDPAFIYFYRGTAYLNLNKGKFDLAIADYNKAIELNPKLSEVFYNRGIAYGSLKKYNSAIADYNKALKLNPKFADALINRGLAYSDKGEYNLAIADYNEALKLNPKDVECFNNRGTAYYKKGDYALAITDYNEAIKLNPKYADAFNNRGNAYNLSSEFGVRSSEFSQYFFRDISHSLGSYRFSRLSTKCCKALINWLWASANTSNSGLQQERRIRSRHYRFQRSNPTQSQKSRYLQQSRLCLLQ